MVNSFTAGGVYYIAFVVTFDVLMGCKAKRRESNLRYVLKNCNCNRDLRNIVCIFRIRKAH